MQHDPIFTGTFVNKVDSKGRVSLPADFRDSLSKVMKDRTFYIFPSPTLPCLEATGEDFIQQIVRSIEAQSTLFSDEEDQLSMLLGTTQRTGFDSTGRFILPYAGREHAGIGDSAVFLGRGRRFQIWSPEREALHSGAVKSEGKIPPLKLVRTEHGHH